MQIGENRSQPPKSGELWIRDPTNVVQRIQDLSIIDTQ